MLAMAVCSTSVPRAASRQPWLASPPLERTSPVNPDPCAVPSPKAFASAWKRSRNCCWADRPRLDEKRLWRRWPVLSERSCCRGRSTIRNCRPRFSKRHRRRLRGRRRREVPLEITTSYHEATHVPSVASLNRRLSLLSNLDGSSVCVPRHTHTDHLRTPLVHQGCAIR